MRVLYDYQAFMQHYGGVSRYFVELTDALTHIDGFEAWIPPPFSDNEFLHTRMTLVTRRHFKGKERIMGVMNRVRERKALKRAYDVFHPTYYNPYFLANLRRPFVVTVHDMIHEIFSRDMVRDDGTARHKRELCARASMIIAVSGNTKYDLCRLLGVPEAKVKVIPHATNLRYSGERPLFERPYVLYVGARSGYKNFGTFLKAAGMILARCDADLVCAGGGSFTPSENDWIRYCGLMGRVHHVSSPSTPHLASLYHFAGLFCYPSLYEGFGIPLLEAFACGCPVAASATSCLPEVGRDAVEFFDPVHAESIATGMERVLRDSSHAAKLRARGLKRLGDFSWEKSAQETLKVYREAS